MSALFLTSHSPITATVVLDHLPDGVAWYEAILNETGGPTDFQLTYHNPLFAQLMPVAYRMTTGQRLLADHGGQEAIWQPLAAYYTTVLETGQVADYILNNPAQEPSVSLRGVPFNRGVLVTVRDLAPEQQQAKAQSQRVRDVLNASLSSTFVYEAIRDATGQIQDFLITFANQTGQRDVMTSFGQEAIGNTLLTIYPDSPRIGQFQHCVRVIETGQPVRLEINYPSLEVWYETSITKSGDGCIVAGINITERKRNELRLQQQATDLEQVVNELRQSNENLRQFAHIASHDLQEPLRRIQSFSDILQNQFEDNLADGERDMARRIQKSARRMQLLIKDLLMYSQLATQRDPLIPVALASILEDVFSDLEMAITENNATVNVLALPTVLGSSSLLHQLFQNLIANALKFQRPGQSPIIEISARTAQPDELPVELQGRSSRFWLITIADNGIGFDERYKSRIFHPFQRLHDASVYSGTGIGLAICQRVAENHGGAIDVSSQPGEGSTFSVFLPVYQAAG